MRTYKSNNIKTALCYAMGLAFCLSTSSVYSHGDETKGVENSKNTYYFDTESGLVNLPKVNVGEQVFQGNRV